MIVHMSLPQNYPLQVTFAHDTSNYLQFNFAHDINMNTLFTIYKKYFWLHFVIIAAVVGRLRISGNN